VTERRTGRPRHTPDVGEGSPREQILDAAAAQFTEHGFAGTSTRMIAERVGIRQASLYYHYAGKDEILADLLSASVRPSLDAVRSLDVSDPVTALYTMAVTDVRTLTSAPHNVGSLYLLPEVNQERYAAFWAERAELQAAYGRLGAAIASDDLGLDADRLGELLIAVVEVVIQLRRVRTPGPQDTDAIAASCLRLCGATPAQINRARRQALASGLPVTA
jgi:AcrR family transcriptional regulator